MKAWCMFLDDERNPQNVTWINLPAVDWVIVRSLHEAIYAMKLRRSFPDMISFDHDLGEGQLTGYDLAKELCEIDMDGDMSFPAGFQFFVHSKNPVGAANIHKYLNRYLEMK